MKNQLATGRSGTTFKRRLFGRPFASHEEAHQLLPKRLALPVFASDPLSSVAYATEEAMLVLDDKRDYVVYQDTDTERTSVLVRRRDGHFDLIES